MLVYLRMHGIPCALGRSAYLSVRWEEGALCVEILAVFVPNMQLPFHRFAKKLPSC